MAIKVVDNAIVFPNGYSQSTARQAPSVLADGLYNTGTAYTISVAGTGRPIQINLCYGGYQCCNAGITCNFRWGIGSLTSNWNNYGGSGVNFVVMPDPAVTVYVSTASAATLYFQVDQTNLSTTTYRCSILQF